MSNIFTVLYSILPVIYSALQETQFQNYSNKNPHINYPHSNETFSFKIGQLNSDIYIAEKNFEQGTQKYDTTHGQQDDKLKNKEEPKTNVIYLNCKKFGSFFKKLFLRQPSMLICEEVDDKPADNVQKNSASNNNGILQNIKNSFTRWFR